MGDPTATPIFAQFLSCSPALQNVFGWQHRPGSRVLCRQEEGSLEEEDQRKAMMHSRLEEVCELRWGVPRVSSSPRCKAQAGPWQWAAAQGCLLQVGFWAVEALQVNRILELQRENRKFVILSLPLPAEAKHNLAVFEVFLLSSMTIFSPSRLQSKAVHTRSSSTL